VKRLAICSVFNSYIYTLPPNAGHATPLSLKTNVCVAYHTGISSAHHEKRGARCDILVSVPYSSKAHCDLCFETISRITFISSKSSPRPKPGSISVPTNSHYPPAAQVFPQLSCSPSSSQLCPGYSLVRWRLKEVLDRDPICMHMSASFLIFPDISIPILCNPPPPNPSCPNETQNEEKINRIRGRNIGKELTSQAQ
jgi:hypothetical protein